MNSLNKQNPSMCVSSSPVVIEVSLPSPAVSFVDELDAQLMVIDTQDSYLGDLMDAAFDSLKAESPESYADFAYLAEEFGIQPHQVFALAQLLDIPSQDRAAIAALLYPEEQACLRALECDDDSTLDSNTPVVVEEQWKVVRTKNVKRMLRRKQKRAQKQEEIDKQSYYQRKRYIAKVHRKEKKIDRQPIQVENHVYVRNIHSKNHTHIPCTKTERPKRCPTPRQRPNYERRLKRQLQKQASFEFVADKVELRPSGVATTLAVTTERLLNVVPLIYGAPTQYQHFCAIFRARRTSNPFLVYNKIVQTQLRQQWCYSTGSKMSPSVTQYRHRVVEQSATYARSIGEPVQGPVTYQQHLRASMWAQRKMPHTMTLDHPDYWCVYNQLYCTQCFLQLDREWYSIWCIYARLANIVRWSHGRRFANARFQAKECTNNRRGPKPLRFKCETYSPKFCPDHLGRLCRNWIENCFFQQPKKHQFVLKYRPWLHSFDNANFVRPFDDDSLLSGPMTEFEYMRMIDDSGSQAPAYNDPVYAMYLQVSLHEEVEPFYKTSKNGKVKLRSRYRVIVNSHDVDWSNPHITYVRARQLPKYVLHDLLRLLKTFGANYFVAAHRSIAASIHVMKELCLVMPNQHRFHQMMWHELYRELCSVEAEVKLNAMYQQLWHKQPYRYTTQNNIGFDPEFQTRSVLYFSTPDGHPLSSSVEANDIIVAHFAYQDINQEHLDYMMYQTTLLLDNDGYRASPEGFDASMVLSSEQVVLLRDALIQRFKLPISTVVITSVVTSLISICHHIYSLVKDHSVANIVLGTTALIGQIANLIIMFAVTFKIMYDEKWLYQCAKNIVEQVVDTLAGKSEVDSNTFYQTMVQQIVDTTLHPSEQPSTSAYAEMVDRFNDIRYEGWDSNMYVKFGTFMIAATITSVSIATGKQIDWHLIKNHQLRKAMTETLKDVNELSEECAHEWFGMQLSQDLHAHQQLEQTYKRMQEFLVMEPQLIVNDLTLYYEIQRLHNSIVQVIGKQTKSDKFGTRNLQTAISQSNNAFSVLVQKVVHMASMRSDRIETFGLQLYSEPSAGKTTFVQRYLMPKIAQKMGWPLDESYSISFSNENDYWPEYGGQRMAFYDEFLAKRDEDPILTHLNKVLSTEFHLIPGAFIKQQFCAFNLLTMCSNMHYIKLLGVMHEKVQAALYSRLHTYEVVNKNYSLIRKGNDSFINRDANAYSDDFSHLTFRRKYIRGENGSPVVEMNDKQPVLTADQLVDEVVSHLKRRESAYVARCSMVGYESKKHLEHHEDVECEAILVEKPVPSDGFTLFHSIVASLKQSNKTFSMDQEQFRTWFQRRLLCLTSPPEDLDVPAVLESLPKAHEGCAEHLKALAYIAGINICVHVDCDADKGCHRYIGDKDSEKFHHFRFFGEDDDNDGEWRPYQEMTLQSDNLQKFVVNLSGPPGGGKSTKALFIAKQFSRLTGFEIEEVVQDSKPLEQFNYLQPKIYVMHDVCTKCDYYQQFYDLVRPGSVLLNTSNIHVEIPWLRAGNWKLYLNFMPGIPPFMPAKKVTWRNMQDPPDGWLRRIGIPGKVVCGTMSQEMPQWIGMHLVVDHFQVCDGMRQLSNTQLFDQLFTRYLKFVERTTEVRFHQVQELTGLKPLLLTDIDVRVWSSSLENLWDMLISPSRILAAFMKPTDDVGIAISRNLLRTKKVEFSPEMFLLRQKPATKEELLDYAKRTYHSLQMDCQDFTVSVKVPETEVFCSKGIVSYTHLQEPEDTFRYEVREHETYFDFGTDDHVTIANEDLAAVLFGNKASVFVKYPLVASFWMKIFNVKTQLLDSQYLSRFKTENVIFETRRQLIHDIVIEQKSSWELFQQSKWYTVLQIVLGITICLSCVVTIVAMFKTLFTTSNVIIPNATASVTQSFDAGKQQFLDDVDGKFNLVTAERHDASTLAFHVDGRCQLHVDFVSFYVDRHMDIHTWGGWGNIRMVCPHMEVTNCVTLFCGDANTDLTIGQVCGECHTQFMNLIEQYKDWIDERYTKEVLVHTFSTEARNNYGGSGGGPKMKTRLKDRVSSLRLRGDLGLKRFAVHQQSYNKEANLKKQRMSVVQRNLSIQSQGVERLPRLYEVDNPVMEVAKELAFDSLCRVEVDGMTMSGTYVKDRFILCPAHLIPKQWDADLTRPHQLVRVHDNQSHDLGRPWYAACFALSRDNEMAILQVLDKTFPSKRDITSWFIKEDQLPLVSGAMLCIARGAERYVHAANMNMVLARNLRIRNFHNMDHSGSYGYAEFLCSSIRNTREGDCGSLYVCTDVAFQKQCLLGQHFAGSPSLNAGFSTVVSQEVLKEMLAGAVIQPEGYRHIQELSALDELPVDFDHMKCDVVIEPAFAEILEAAEEPDWLTAAVRDDDGKNLTILGHVRGFGMINSQATDARKPTPWSPLIEHIVPNLKAPSVMKPEQAVDTSLLDEHPLIHRETGATRLSIPWYQLSAYCDDWQWDDSKQALLDEAFELYCAHAIPIYSSGKFRTLSDYEVLNGIHEGHWAGELDDMDLDSSAGPYRAFLYGKQKKESYFKQYWMPGERKEITFDDDTEAGADVHQSYKRKVIWAREQHARLVFPAKDCLKSELLPLDKVSKGRTRVFTGVDTVDVLFCRYVCGTVLAAFKKHREHGHCQVGIDPIKEFTRLMLRFRKISEEGHAGDYKQFDKHLLPQTISKAFEFIYKLMLSNTDEDPQQLRNLLDVCFDDFVHTLTVCNGTLYMKHKGNPSGCVLNSTVNSIVNDLMVMTTVVKAMKAIPKQIAPTNYLEFLRKNLDWVDLGDDVVIVVGDELKPYYPYSVCSRLMKEIFCITLTHPSKDETRQPPEFTPLHECDFLSRRFHSDGDVMVWARLKTSTITSLLHWTSSLSNAQLVDNIDCVLQEAVLHDEQFYNTIRECVKIAKQRCPNLNIEVPAYHHMRRRIQNSVLTGAKCTAGIRVKTVNSLGAVPKTLKIVPQGLQQLHDTDSRGAPISSEIALISVRNNLSSFRRNKEQKVLFHQSIIQNLSQMSSQGSTASSKNQLVGQCSIKVHAELALQLAVQLCAHVIVACADPLYRYFKSFPTQLDETTGIRYRFVEVGTKRYAAVLSESVQYGYFQQGFVTDEYLAQVRNYGKFFIEGHCILARYRKHLGVQTQGGVTDTPTSSSGGPSADDVMAGTTPQAESFTAGVGLGERSVPVTKTALKPALLSAGGFQTDLLDQCYNRYHSLGEPITVTQDKVAGTVLFDIPYGANLFNPFMQAWCKMHQRFAGDLDLQMIMSGAEIYRGLLYIGVVPMQKTTYTVQMLESYACKIVPLNQVSVQTFELGFVSGQRYFWNKNMAGELVPYSANSDNGAIDDARLMQPRLVCMIYVQMDNPFENPASTCTIRLRSKFASNFKAVVVDESVIEGIANQSAITQMAAICATGARIPRGISMLEGKTLIDILQSVFDDDFVFDPKRLQLVLSGNYYPAIQRNYTRGAYRNGPGFAPYEGSEHRLYSPIKGSEQYNWTSRSTLHWTANKVTYIHTTVHADQTKQGDALDMQVVIDGTVDVDAGNMTNPDHITSILATIHRGVWYRHEQALYGGGIEEPATLYTSTDHTQTVTRQVEPDNVEPSLESVSTAFVAALPLCSSVPSPWGTYCACFGKQMQNPGPIQDIMNSVTSTQEFMERISDVYADDPSVTVWQTNAKMTGDMICELMVYDFTKPWACWLGGTQTYTAIYDPILGSEQTRLELHGGPHCSAPDGWSRRPIQATHAMRIRVPFAKSAACRIVHDHGVLDVICSEPDLINNPITNNNIRWATISQFLAEGVNGTASAKFTDWDVGQIQERHFYTFNRMWIEETSTTPPTYVTQLQAHLGKFYRLPADAYQLTFGYGPVYSVNETMYTFPSAEYPLLNNQLLSLCESVTCEDEVLDFDLVDAATAMTIAHVRYNPSTDCFYVISTETLASPYAFYEADIGNIKIMNASTNKVTSSLAQSRLGYWTDRTIRGETAASVLPDKGRGLQPRQKRYLRTIRLEGAASSAGVALLGGIMSGAGAGISTVYQNEFMQRLQQNKFDFQTTLTQMQQQYGEAMFDKNADLQKDLQRYMIANQVGMQQASFGQQEDMAKLNLANAKDFERFKLDLQGVAARNMRTAYATDFVPGGTLESLQGSEGATPPPTAEQFQEQFNNNVLGTTGGVADGVRRKENGIHGTPAPAEETGLGSGVDLTNDFGLDFQEPDLLDEPFSRPSSNYGSFHSGNLNFWQPDTRSVRLGSIASDWSV